MRNDGYDKKENALLGAESYERDACILRDTLGREKCRRAVVDDRCSGDRIFACRAVSCWKESFFQAAYLSSMPKKLLSQMVAGCLYGT